MSGILKLGYKLDGYAATSAKLAHLSRLFTTKEEINATVAEATTQALRGHLEADYATKPNKLGGPSTGFWRKAIESIESESEGTTVTVRMTQTGLRLRFYGGVVVPSGRTSEVTGKPIKFLAFPVSADVYGKAPAEVSFKMYAKPGGLFRQLGDKRSEQDPKMFALARKTTHLPDPNILPTANQVLDANAAALGDLIDAITSAS